MRTFISSHPDWLTEVRLPAYAPDLNPAEGAWANMKNGLGNLAAGGWCFSCVPVRHVP